LQKFQLKKLQVCSFKTAVPKLFLGRSKPESGEHPAAQDANIVLKKILNIWVTFDSRLLSSIFKVRNLLFSQAPIRYREGQTSRQHWKYTIQFWIASARPIFDPSRP